MAAKTLESRFERMSVNDENEQAQNHGYHKPKVISRTLDRLMHVLTLW